MVRAQDNAPRKKKKQLSLPMKKKKLSLPPKKAARAAPPPDASASQGAYNLVLRLPPSMREPLHQLKERGTITSINNYIADLVAADLARAG